jgi:transposase-like protein
LNQVHDQFLKIARELDVFKVTLRAWVKKSSDSSSKEKHLSPENEIKQLKKEIKELKTRKRVTIQVSRHFA